LTIIDVDQNLSASTTTPFLALSTFLTVNRCAATQGQLKLSKIMAVILLGRDSKKCERVMGSTSAAVSSTTITKYL
jgi:hypothetical protein